MASGGTLGSGTKPLVAEVMIYGGCMGPLRLRCDLFEKRNDFKTILCEKSLLFFTL